MLSMIYVPMLSVLFIFSSWCASFGLKSITPLQISVLQRLHYGHSQQSYSKLCTSLDVSEKADFGEERIPLIEFQADNDKPFISVLTDDELKARNKPVVKPNSAKKITSTPIENKKLKPFGSITLAVHLHSILVILSILYLSSTGFEARKGWSETEVKGLE
jgi:hypothetical protein